MRKLSSKSYLICFYHEGDLNRVLNNRLWTYEQCLLVLQKLLPNEDPKIVLLDDAEFLIQFHNLPLGFRSEVVIKAIGSFLGLRIKSDERNFDGSMHANILSCSSTDRCHK